MNNLSVDHLTGIKDLTRADIELIFKTADSFKEVINRPIKKVPSLRDITIANIFFENSTRTRLSFELAEKRLSADTVNFSAASSSVKKGETLIDTVNNILAMKVDMVVMRHPNPGAALFLSQKVKARVINAGDGTHEHPTQALLDAFSISNLKSSGRATIPIRGQIYVVFIRPLIGMLSGYPRYFGSQLLSLTRTGLSFVILRNEESHAGLTHCCGVSSVIPRSSE